MRRLSACGLTAALLAMGLAGVGVAQAADQGQEQLKRLKLQMRQIQQEQAAAQEAQGKADQARQQAEQALKSAQTELQGAKASAGITSGWVGK